MLLELDHVSKKFGSVVVAGRLNIRIFPVGYYLWPAGEDRRKRLAPGRRKRLAHGRHSAG